MKINELTYSEGKTIQEESFQPRSFHVSAKAELAEGDDITQAYKELKKAVKESLNTEVSKYKLSKKINQDEKPWMN